MTGSAQPPPAARLRRESPFSDITVNGQVIPAAAIAAEAQLHRAAPDKPLAPWSQAARALVIRTLLLQEADRIGVRAVPLRLGEGRRETDDEARTRTVLEGALRPEPPTEAMIAAAYAAGNPRRFRGPSLFEAAHILFAAPPTNAVGRARAKAQAAEVLQILGTAPDRFEVLARERSSCPSGANGGRLGQLSSGDTVPEFEAVLEALAPGELSPEPVATRYGYHVIRLDARADGDVLPLETVRPRIREALEKRAWTRAARRYIESLIAAAEIIGIDMTPSGAADRPSP
ncbi:MAG: peptidylprolyl isomerase [Paracoccaceae bacterium]|nr:peptidylprolyl isomerase [Paracoccaceae bacterium]